MDKIYFDIWYAVHLGCAVIVAQHIFHKDSKASVVHTTLGEKA